MSPVQVANFTSEVAAMNENRVARCGSVDGLAPVFHRSGHGLHSLCLLRHRPSVLSEPGEEGCAERVRHHQGTCHAIERKKQMRVPSAKAGNAPGAHCMRLLQIDNFC
jgi:hypothetical protein